LVQAGVGFKAQDSRLKIQDSRFKIQDSRFLTLSCHSTGRVTGVQHWLTIVIDRDGKVVYQLLDGE